MKNKKKSFLVIGSVLIIAFIYNNFFLKSMITGTYINNYDEEVFSLGAPNGRDTLRLFDNNQFTSNYWGKGTYNINYTIKGTEIELSYVDSFGKAGYHRYLTRIWYGRIKLILDWDLNYYFEKID